MAKKARSLSPGRTFDTFWVMINLSGPRYWKVSPTGIEKVGAPLPHEGPVLCFDETSDFRVAYPKNGSIKQAAKYFLTEKQEKCRVFMGSKYNLGAGNYTPYYGTAVNRVDQFAHRLFPGAYFIDQLVVRQKIKLSEDRVVGFKFEEQTDSGDGFSIIILYGLRTNGDMTEPQVSLNPPELDLIIRDYAQTNGIENFEPMLFTIDDLARVPQGIGYPVEAMVGTVPVRYFTSMVALGLLGTAGLSFAYSGYLWLSIESAKRDATVAEKRASDAKKKTEQLLIANLPQLAERTSVDYSRLFTYSEQIYNPVMSIKEASITRETGAIQVDVFIFGGPSKELNPYNDISALVNSDLPPGLVRKNTYVSGDSNAYKIQFEFQSLDSTIHSLIGLK